MYKYERFAQQVREQIATHKLQEGDKLPSIRQLSKSSGLSKISVQTALQKLESEGLLSARFKSGYYVTAIPNHQRAPLHRNTISAPRPVTVPDIFHQIMARSAAFDIKPDSSFVPASTHLQILNRLVGRAMRHQAFSKALYYSEPQGDVLLRQQLQKHYKSFSLQVDPEEICLTSGCQNSLFLALSACCKAGDSVIVESPAFYGVLQLLEHLNLNAIEVSVSTTQGMTAKQLAQASEKWHAKVCVLTPNFSTPTGACMPRHEKQRIAQLAHDKGLTIIEDDIYGDLGFTFRPEPIKSFDTNGRVILCSSFSKSLSRDVRIGWIMGGLYHPKIVQLKLVNQLAGSRSTQEGLASFLKEGHYRRHLQVYRNQLLHQRTRLLELINECMSGPLRYTVPDGGLSLWLELDASINTVNLYNEASRQGITLTPRPVIFFHPSIPAFFTPEFRSPLYRRKSRCIKDCSQDDQKTSLTCQCRNNRFCLSVTPYTYVN